MEKDEIALMICSKKAYRRIEDYALTMIGIPPLHKSAQKILAEDAEKNRLYYSYLEFLQQAVSLGELKAKPNLFANNSKEYVCKFTDFIDWYAKSGYGNKMTIAKYLKRETQINQAFVKSTRRAQQIPLLLSIIDEHCTDRLNIPLTKKQDVLRDCLKHNKVFTSQSVFDKTWAELSKAQKISIENKEKYL